MIFVYDLIIWKVEEKISSGYYDCSGGGGGSGSGFGDGDGSGH